jgi:thioredoxin 2
METLVVRCAACGGLNRVKAERLADSPACGRCQAALDTSGRPVHLDDDALQRLVASSPVPVLVDFYADWCGPCRALAPSLEQLGKENAGKLLVVKVDTEKYKQTANQLGVSGIPALFVYRGGQVVDRQAGALPLGSLRQWVARHL